MARAPALRITRLKVVNWRNFREAEVRLALRGFFVGPNASGKSNLLDAVRFLRDLVKPVAGGLATAVETRGGLSKLRCLHAKGVGEVEIEIDVGDDATPALWSYALAFTRHGRSGPLMVRREEVRMEGSKVGGQSSVEHSESPDRYSQTLVEQVVQRENFRPLVLFLQSIRYLHVVPQIVRDPRRQLESDDAFGGDLLRRISDTPERTRRARLARVSDALRIAVPQFEELKFVRDKNGLPHLAAAFSHWRPNTSDQFEDQFSDGTLRLIGFLWSISERDGPLLLEEPELSLNDDIVRQLPVLIARMQRKSGRQVLMTTHSEVLLDDSGIGLDEVHRLEPTRDGTKIITTNLEEDIQNEVDSGFSLGQAVMPKVKRGSIHQLSLFDVFS